MTTNAPPCDAGGEHDWDLGAMGPGVASMSCTKCDWVMHMKAGKKTVYRKWFNAARASRGEDAKT